eukprot:evm.model.scf_124.9 EVM.evm.TU.scf_124.9   scf_124:108800-112500(-)
MHGRKMELLQATSRFLLDKLAEDDGKHQTGVVVYADDVVDLVELQPVTKEILPLMKRAIDSVFAYGQTFLSGGLKRGLEQQRNGPQKFSRNVFLFTDGLPTIGATTTRDILREVRQALGEGGSFGDGPSGSPIVISTFAVGDEIDVNLLKDIARVGGGQAYIIRNEDDIPIAFGDAIGGLLSTVAQDINVFFRPINGAFIRKGPQKKIKTGGSVTEFEDGTR